MTYPLDAPEQAVVLVGGRGTRLGDLTADLPKPLLDIAGRPFLDYLLESCLRFGFREVLLLAGYRAAEVARYVEARRGALPAGIRLEAVVEVTPRGTAGALRHAVDRLEPQFLLVNGDSFLDANWLDLVPISTAAGTMLVMALCRVADASRFGEVAMESERVMGFAERGAAGPGLINAGIYVVDRRIVAGFPESGSIERLVLPELAARGLVRGRAYDGYFIDIGVPAALKEAQTTLPQRRLRSAVFFDRDGTLVADGGHVYRPEDLVFLPGAIAAVKRVNDLGRYAFLVTNQAGVARGYFTEADVKIFNAELQRRLRAAGAHFDDMRYCPFHPAGKIEAYRCASDWRKPAPGMLLDLMRSWPVRHECSWVVGDKESDVLAAKAAGLHGVLYSGGDLDTFLSRQIVARSVASS